MWLLKSSFVSLPITWILLVVFIKGQSHPWLYLKTLPLTIYTTGYHDILRGILLFCVCVAVLGLRCCVQLSLVVVCRLLNVVAILAAEHGLQGMWAQKLRCTGLAALCMWDLSSWTRLNVSPALAEGFLTSRPPGKSQNFTF